MKWLKEQIPKSELMEHMHKKMAQIEQIGKQTQNKQ